METIAALVTRSSNDKDAIGNAISDSVGEERMGSAGGREFTPADVDDMSTALNSLCDGSCEVELGARSERAIDSISKDRHDQTPTMRRDSPNWGAVLAENNTRDVSAVL
jgi:hypothetical protein